MFEKKMALRVLEKSETKEVSGGHSFQPNIGFTQSLLEKPGLSITITDD